MATTQFRPPRLLELTELQAHAYRFAILCRAASGRLPAAQELGAQLDIGLGDAEACLRTMADRGIVPNGGAL